MISPLDNVSCLMGMAQVKIPIRHNILSDGDVKVFLSYNSAWQWIGVSGAVLRPATFPVGEGT